MANVGGRVFEQKTNGVIIRVEPDFELDESEPAEHLFVWSYTVEIENASEEEIQLLTREWRITDARGRTRIVRGDGVVGEQPVLAPGERFRYTSGAPLNTPSGFMSGHYGMRGSDGRLFDAMIPPFPLDDPFDRSAVH